jgi:maltodextrin utilization protein YvdJ
LKSNWLGAHFTGGVIDPFSRVYNIWSSLLIFSFLYNMFLVPIAICFAYELEKEAYAIDSLVVLITILDIGVKFISAIIYENGTIERDKAIIGTTYANSTFLIDVLAAIPVDYLGFEMKY